MYILLKPMFADIYALHITSVSILNSKYKKNFGKWNEEDVCNT